MLINKLCTEVNECVIRSYLMISE